MADFLEKKQYAHHREVFHPHALYDQTQRGKESKAPWHKKAGHCYCPAKTYPHDNYGNGPEFATHPQITRALEATVYFTAPYASWQKGAIENTNKLIRQYIPNSANFNEFAEKKITMIQKKINRGAGQKLYIETSKNEFYRRINQFCSCCLTLRLSFCRKVMHYFLLSFFTLSL